MRKRIIGQGPGELAGAQPGWIDLERLAQVEITSEDVDHPIESALIPDTGPGWQAAQPGEQTIRLWFDEPLSVKRINLEFQEAEQGRTQEFVLRWSPDGGQSYREIVRQQYNFSPPAATHEVEDYKVDLANVTVLELKIVPDISGGRTRASLAQLRIGSFSA
ncbi:MAG: hypothetical protein ACLFUU_09695 [Desulfobacteraceae bacterium]